MNILSVDWDYFFPNLSEYDWGADEKKHYFFEMVWPVRYYDRGLFTKKRACEHLLPTGHKTFWEKVLAKSKDTIRSIVITDSHKDIEIIIKGIKYNQVWNFDQHHDMDTETSELDCSNWVTALNVPLEKYHLVFPSWMKECNMHKNIYYYIPENLPKFSTIFICRSSCWTPSWADDDWVWFIDQLQSMFPVQWRRKIALEYALEARPFNINTAKQFRFKNGRTDV